MTPEDVIRGFREEVEQTCEEKEYANTLFQEAIKTGMEINQTYHTPEELVKLMGKLTGKAVDKSFRRFIRILEKILYSEKMYFSIPGVIFRIRVELKSEMVY